MPLSGHWKSGLPLIDCSVCGREKVVELTSRRKTNPWNNFVKCPKNQRNVSFAMLYDPSLVGFVILVLIMVG